MIIVLYVAVQWIINALCAGGAERRQRPPGHVTVVVALSQFGFWWILLATPVTAVLRDLFRYGYGHFRAAVADRCCQ
jgi:hypothetical protein